MSINKGNFKLLAPTYWRQTINRKNAMKKMHHEIKCVNEPLNSFVAFNSLWKSEEEKNTLSEQKKFKILIIKHWGDHPFAGFQTHQLKILTRKMKMNENSFFQQQTKQNKTWTIDLGPM